MEQALKEFEHKFPKQHYYGPSKMLRPDYGQKVQYAKVDNTETMSAAEIKHKERVTGKFLFYARAIDNTMGHALNDIASAKNTKAGIAAVEYFLNYAASNPNAELIYRASEMVLQGDSDAAYLVCDEARSRAGGYFFLGNHDRKLFNGPVMVLAKIIKNVMASAAEAEVGALFMNAQEAVPMRLSLEELGHKQPATPLKIDNSTATGIINNTIKQKRSKAIDMRFYWLRDRVKQGQFQVYWEPGLHNLADYTTKHHSGSHHKLVRPIYLYNAKHSPRTVQGCVEILKTKTNNRQATNGTTNIPTKDRPNGAETLTGTAYHVTKDAYTSSNVIKLKAPYKQLLRQTRSLANRMSSLVVNNSLLTRYN